MNSKSIEDNTTYHGTGALIYNGEKIAEIERFEVKRVLKKLRSIEGEIFKLKDINSEKINKLINEDDISMSIEGTLEGIEGKVNIEGVKLNGFPILESSFKATKIKSLPY